MKLSNYPAAPMNTRHQTKIHFGDIVPETERERTLRQISTSDELREHMQNSIEVSKKLENSFKRRKKLYNTLQKIIALWG